MEIITAVRVFVQDKDETGKDFGIRLDSELFELRKRYKVCYTDLKPTSAADGRLTVLLQFNHIIEPTKPSEQGV